MSIDSFDIAQYDEVYREAREPVFGGERWPDGEYDVAVAQAGLRRNKKQKLMVAVAFASEEDPGWGWTWLNQVFSTDRKKMGFLKKVLRQLGAQVTASLSQELEAELLAMKGRRFRIKLVTNADTNFQNTYIQSSASEGTEASPATSSSPPPPPSDAFNDEDIPF